MKAKHWNKCDGCGRFVAYLNMYRALLTPSSHYTKEEYETLCERCYHDEIRLRVGEKPCQK